MRIGILECGQVIEDLRDAFGDYPSMFRRLLSGVDSTLLFQNYPVLSGELPGTVDDCDVYVISGSRFSVFDDEDWIAMAHDFVRELDRCRKKTVGICFGHQLIANALDGNVIRSEKGWGVGVHEWRVLHRPRWMVPGRDEFSLLVSHQDQVTDLPTNATLLASSDFCPIAAYQIHEHFLAIQGHPEFGPDYADALLDIRLQQIGRGRVSEARQTLADPVQDGVVATWLVNFLAGETATDQA